MLPTLAKHWDAMESRRRTFLADLAATSPAGLAFRPAPEAWSLEDLAQHLWLIEKGAVHILRDRFDKPPLKAGMLAPLKVAAMRVLVPRGIRIKAPVKEIIPQRRMTVDEVRAEWDGTRATLHGLLERVTPERLGKRIFRHPIFGPLTIAQSAEFVWRHHDHHAHQVRRIRGAAGFPG
jgi:DinB superfamily